MGSILETEQIERFIKDGFVRIDRAFDHSVAEEAVRILWQDIPANPFDPSTWKQPVVRLGWYTQPPFIEAANTAVLHKAFDQLVGEGRWVRRGNMGSFPVRFPSDSDPGDTGWHVDASFPGKDATAFSEWRVNLRSKGRALLMLFLFSDVGENDAPTRIRVGSHMDIARLLTTEGEEGLSFMEIAAKIGTLPEREVAVATGSAGTVYLCHPFIVHAAQAHRGRVPRFLAQPPLELKEELRLERADQMYSPVEQAIRLAL